MALPTPILWAGTSEPLPGASIYHFNMTLTDEDGKTLKLADMRGQVVVIALIYSHCTSACPLLRGDLKRLYQTMEPAQRSKVQFLLVTLDPSRDTSVRLKQLEVNLGVDPATWHLVRTSEDDLRQIAAVLTVKYTQGEDGIINHTAVITLLDNEGVPRARIEGLSQPQENMLSQLKSLIPTSN